MEQFHNGFEMLDLITQPAFCVRSGKILKTNPAAAAFHIETGANIESFLHTGAEEYTEFGEGCLYLTLRLGGQIIGASVSRMQDFDVFRINQEDADAGLRALALAAQELRTPLGSIMSVSDTVFSEILADHADLQVQAASINHNLFRLLRIIGNMSDAAAYTADKGTRQEVRNISAVLDDIFQRAAELVACTGISFSYTGLDEKIYTLLDAQKLERAVLNIVSNAIKFTPAGGSIQGKLIRRGKKLYLSVSDSGGGIDESFRGSLFSRYLRQPGLEDPRQGLGLGMVLVRSTAALHGGTVLVDHPENTGCRITVSISIRQEDTSLRSPMLRFDYAGEWDHGLIELSDVLPPEVYNFGAPK